MKLKFEYKLLALYLILGFLWIFLSDRAILIFTDDIEYIRSIQTVKGSFYVFLTALLFFAFLKKYLQNIRKSKEELERKIVYFYSVLNNLPIGISLFSMEKNNTIFLNKINRELLGIGDECSNFTGCIYDVVIDNDKLINAVNNDRFYDYNWMNVSLKNGKIICFKYEN